MSPQSFADNRRPAAADDPLFLFVPAGPWHTEWKYRFLPPSSLAACSAQWDHGLDHLLYIQALLTED
jgi:hypothetical protein